MCTRARKVQLKHAPRWKENPEQVLEVMSKASEKWAQGETESQDRPNDGRRSKSKES